MKAFMRGYYIRSDVTRSEACQISVNFSKGKFDRQPASRRRFHQLVRLGGLEHLQSVVRQSLSGLVLSSPVPRSGDRLFLARNSANEAERRRRLRSKLATRLVSLDDKDRQKDEDTSDDGNRRL
jgi:hypothetical protein